MVSNNKSKNGNTRYSPYNSSCKKTLLFSYLQYPPAAAAASRVEISISLSLIFLRNPAINPITSHILRRLNSRSKGISLLTKAERINFLGTLFSANDRVQS